MVTVTHWSTQAAGSADTARKSTPVNVMDYVGLSICVLAGLGLAYGLETVATLNIFS